MLSGISRIIKYRMLAFKKILDLLTESEKKRAIFLLFLILIMAIIDMLGVASILPFIGVLANPNLIETNLILKNIYLLSNSFGVNNINQFLFALGITVFLLLMISLILRAITQYVQVHFSFMREYSIGKRLIEGYLHQPYSWFLSRHSADLGKSILSEVSETIGGVIMPILTIISQTIVVIALLLLLIVIDPLLAISIGTVLFISYGIVFYFMKNLLSKIGSERLKANTDRFATISEAFGAAKEVKVGGLEQVYIDRFVKPAHVYAKNKSLASVIGQLPRFFIEGVAFGGMIILTLLMMIRGNGFANIVPIIALYTFAGYRLMPALQQIYASVTQLRFSNSTLNALHKDLMSLKYKKNLNDSKSIIQLKKNIKLNDIYFNYPNKKIPALKKINVEIPAFQKIGVIGLTGSGKTTMIDIILGLLEPTQGTLSVDDKLIDSSNKRSWQRNIGYVPQQIYLSDATVAENIAFGEVKERIDLKAMEEASRMANLHNFVINELPDNYHTTIGERGVRLSGGQRQRIAIARALYHKPEILILDEATSALDNFTEKAVMEAMDNLANKITIILIAHRLTTVKNCDTVFLIDNGSLKSQGSFEEVSKSGLVFNK